MLRYSRTIIIYPRNAIACNTLLCDVDKSGGIEAVETYRK